MLVLKPTIKTSCTKEQLIKALIFGWYKEFGAYPKKESIGVLYAQNAIETGGTVAMWNWNIGNVKAVDSPSSTIEYCVLKGTWEMINGVKKILLETDPGSWFRSFNSLEEGISFHINFLKGRRYKIAWSAIEAGDPADFAHKLKQFGYYTALESDYVKAINYHFTKYMALPIFENALSELQITVFPVTPSTEPVAPVSPWTPVSSAPTTPTVIIHPTIEFTFWQKLLMKLLQLFKR